MDITLPRVLPYGALPGSAPDLQLAPPRASSAAAASTAGGAATAAGVTGAAASATAAGAASPAGSATQQAVESFSTLLQQAMESLNAQFQAADQGAMQLAAGDPVDLHTVTIAMEQAELSLSLALQVRNKLLEAYQEVMRMNV